jgi:hypothetical protein
MISHNPMRFAAVNKVGSIFVNMGIRNLYKIVFICILNTSIAYFIIKNS